MNPLVQLKQTTPLFLVALLLACFALPREAEATDLGGVLPGGNTADGAGVLTLLTTGFGNSGFGAYALYNDRTGSRNTATGYGALYTNNGNDNTAFGFATLPFNIDSANTAVGSWALFNNESGRYNVATGYNALYSNTTGFFNTAVGTAALFNSTGNGNTATGAGALSSNTTGGFNTAIGGDALYGNTTGSSNIALGTGAGINVITASNVICIGTAGQDVSNSCFVGQIFGATVTEGVGVIVDSDGHLGTAVSSARFKEQIKPMDKTSEAILALKPVTFRYKKERDPKQIPQFGLVAEEVEKVNPDLVVRDKEGKPYSVRYDQVNAMLLNEFLKEHRKNEEQEKTIEELKSGMAALFGTVKEQAAQIQRVSAQLEANKPASQVVNNP